MAVEVLEMPTCHRYRSARYAYCTGLTELQASAIDGSNYALSLIFHDDRVNNMRPWWYYCEREDRDFLKSRPLEEIEAEIAARAAAAAAVQEEAVAPEPAEFTLDEETAAAREGECTAWLKIPRNKRKPYSMGGLLAGGNCFNKEDSIVVKGLPAELGTLYGDLREFLGEIAVVIDLYKPARGPLFLGLMDGKSVKAVLDAYPHGLRYKESVLTFERAMNRSKTSAEMASGKSV
jgi:hypothetical protein